MLLLWKEDIAFWRVALAYALIGIGVGLAGTPASHALTSSVPVRRAGMASGTADLQRDLGGAVLQSVFGALLTAGYASAFARELAGAPRADQSAIDATQTELENSFASAGRTAQRYPQYAEQIIGAARRRSSTATSGPMSPASARSWSARCWCSSSSPSLSASRNCCGSTSQPTGSGSGRCGGARRDGRDSAAVTRPISQSGAYRATAGPTRGRPLLSEHRC